MITLQEKIDASDSAINGLLLKHKVDEAIQELREAITNLQSVHVNEYEDGYDAAMEDILALIGEKLTTLGIKKK